MRFLIISKGLILFIAGSILGCTPKNYSPQTLENIGITGSGDFGSIQWNQTISKIISLKNNSSSTLSLSPSIEGANAGSFILVSSRGCVDLAPQGVCSLKITISARGLPAGTHEANLNLGETESIPLSATIDITPEPILEVQVDGIVKIEPGLDIVIEGRQRVTKIIALRNIGPIVMDSQSLTKDLDDLIILNNYCSSKLLPGKMCYIKIGVQGKNEISQQSGNLLLGSVLQIPVTIKTSNITEHSNLVSSTEDLNFGYFSEALEKHVEILTFINTGAVGGNLTPDLPPGYSVVFNSCASVPPRGKCYLKIQYANQNANIGSYSNEISLGNSIINFSSGVVSSKPLDHLVLSSKDNLHNQECEPLQISLEDSNNSPYAQGSPLVLSLAGTIFYGESNCENQISSVSIEPLNSQKIVYLKNATLGNISLSVSAGVIVGTRDVFIYEDLSVTPSSATLSLANSLSLGVSGGKAPYVFQIISGGGTIENGVYSPTTVGPAVIKIEDSVGQEVQVNLIINSNLNIAAGLCSAETLAGDSCQINASGGVGSLTYSTDLPSVINPSTGVLTPFCLGNDNSIDIRVSDSHGNQTSMSYSFNCVFESCNQIKADGYGSTDGSYWIDPDGLNNGDQPILAYCDLNSGDGGWTMIASGGSGCISGSTNSLVEKNSGINLSSCGYLPSARVQKIAQKINTVRLRAGLNHTTNYTQVTSSGPNTINALKNNQGWHSARTEWSAGWTWGDPAQCAGGIGSATGWPQMYHSCNLANGVHWLVGSSNANHYRVYGDPATEVRSSTWVKSNYYKVPRSCLEAKNKGVLNTQGTTASGTYTIDTDGYGTGREPLQVYCDQETAGGGWTLVAFNNGNTGTSQVSSSFLVSELRVNNMTNISATPSSSSLNVENMSARLNSTDVMLKALSYSSSPIIETGIGQWNYNSTKCSGLLRHTSRSAGCVGQNANDNFNSADAFNISVNSGNEGIVPAYGTELCYSGRGWCNFQFFLR